MLPASNCAYQWQFADTHPQAYASPLIGQQKITANKTGINGSRFMTRSQISALVNIQDALQNQPRIRLQAHRIKGLTGCH